MTVILRPIESGQPARVIRGSGRELAGGIAFHPNGEDFVYGDGCWLRFAGDRHSADWSKVKKVRGPFHCVSFSPDGRWIAATTADGTLRIRETLTGKIFRQFDFERGPTQSKESGSFAVQKHGPLIATCHFDHGLYLIDLWNTETQKRIRTYGTHQSWAFDSVAFSPDGRLLAAVRFEGLLEVWDVTLETKVPVAEIQVGRAGFWCPSVCFLPDGRHIVTGNGNASIYVIRLPKAALPD